MDKLLDRLHELEAPWDDVREQRVLKRIQENRRRPNNRRVRLKVGIGVAAAVFVAVVVGLISTQKKEPDELGTTEENTIATETNEQITSKDAAQSSSVLALPNAGQVTMTAGARVSVLMQIDKLLVLEQVEGQARYEITKNKDRTVVVRAVGIEITVIGTIFTVSIEDSRIQVQVERGVVRIDDGNQRVDLETGEKLTIKRPGARDEKRIAPTDTQSTSSSTSRQSVDALFKDVDRARSRGALDKAARLLHKIIARKESKSSAASAQFMLGKVERARGRHRMAAGAFRRCLKLSPKNPLDEDALAEEAISWAAAKQTKRAKATAAAYIAAYPNGIHASRMSHIVE
ncbi:MAG: hypothetical protein GY854_31200 [Deltaproteobacteria bacterium]|nr:hypothetical protein [Deltaproteobacteria bacterium]